MIENEPFLNLIVILSFIGAPIIIISMFWLLIKSIEAQDKIEYSKLGKKMNIAWLVYFLFLGIITIASYVNPEFRYLGNFTNYVIIFMVLLPILIQKKVMKKQK